MEALYAPGTRRHVEAIGVAPGWRCLEVGGGGGLRVPSSVEILRHDVAAGPPPQREFDLVHARLLLLRAPQRAAVLRSLVSALKPGGWLLVEDVDCRILGCQDGAAAEPAQGSSATASRTASDTVVVARVLWAMGQVMTSNGVDLAYGRKLHGLLSGTGLVDVAAERRLETGAGGSPLGALHRANMEQLRDEAVVSGMVTGREIDRACHVVMDPGSAVVTPGIIISARGRRPR